MITRAAGRAGREHGVTVVLTVPTAFISPLHALNAGVLLFAQGMDPDSMGDGMNRVFAESLVDAGASGVMLNHTSNPLSPSMLEATLRRADSCGLLTIVCADTVADVETIAFLQPSAILFEPPSLIGTASADERDWIGPIDEVVRRASPKVLTMHAGGVSSPAIAQSIMRAGADGTGSTSGVLSAHDPLIAARDFIAATAAGWEAAQHRDQAPEPSTSDRSRSESEHR
ncbi:MAG: triose-phosphate isomerase [Actinomycetota bacterium]|nr:triose-phosphate isomerase [Actinomycetota bacterium]